MDLVPRRRRIAFLPRPDELDVRRRFHGRGPSLSVVRMLSAIDLNLGLQEEEEEEEEEEEIYSYMNWHTGCLGTKHAMVHTSFTPFGFPVHTESSGLGTRC